MKTILLVLFVGLTVLVYGQKNNELDNRNGFKNIKLLSKVDSYKGLVFDKVIDEKKSIHQYKRLKSAFPSIGEIDIKDLTLLTYKDLIYQINITTTKDPQLFKGLEKAFGKAQHSVRYQKYFWEGDQVKLTFESIASNKLQLTYHAKGIKAIMKSDKQKKIDRLSTEF